MVKFLCIFLVLSSIEIIRVASSSLTISPDHVHVTWHPPQSANFTCDTNVSLTRCQFRLWNVLNNRLGPTLELSRGPQSQANRDHLDKDSLTSYSYNGWGLEAGDCGVSLQVKGNSVWVVACRVRTERGRWRYSWADLYVSDWEPVPHNLKTPREVVVHPGGEARFRLDAQEPLSSCSFTLRSRSDWVDFDNGAKSADNTGRHRYLGAGLQRGQCGIALTNISEADNGPICGGILTPKYKTGRRVMALIVARPPTTPTMNLTYTDTNVTATCEVKEGRPVAKISWVLGDDIIRQDENNDFQPGAQDEWRWPWMQESIQQTLTLQLQPQHNGKDLKCRVSHFTWLQSLEAKETISLTGPTASPTPQTTTRSTTNINPSPACSSDEVHELRVREAVAAARTAELAEEAARLTLQVATTRIETETITLEAAQSGARAEGARARKEEALAQNAEEELKFERERRAKRQ